MCVHFRTPYYAIPIASLNLSVEGKKIRKIYPKDLLQYNSLNSTLFEWTTAGFGIDCIDQTNLIPHSKNEKQNKIQDKGISVTDYVKSNPCENCKARGLEYSALWRVIARQSSAKYKL